MLKYSIIIPVYNCKDYLESCVDSVINQSYDEDYEIIIVDDESSDSSGQLADKLAVQFEKVRTFHKQNGGAASARNYGLSKANGQYILFIDSDDTVDHNLLEKVDAILKNDKYTWIIYGMAFDYYRNQQLNYSENLSCVHKGVYDKEQVLQEFQSIFLDNAISSSCNKVFASEVIHNLDIRFRDDMTLYEDFDFNLQYLIHINTITFIDEPLYHYRHNLEQPHINSRISDLSMLRNNLSWLLESVLMLCNSEQCSEYNEQIYHIAVNLYMQLLMQYLMIRKYGFDELGQILTTYCEEPIFRKLLSLGGKLSAYEKDLLNRIDQKQFRSISVEFRKRRMLSSTKKTIKRMVLKKDNTVR